MYFSVTTLYLKPSKYAGTEFGEVKEVLHKAKRFLVLTVNVEADQFPSHHKYEVLPILLVTKGPV